MAQPKIIYYTTPKKSFSPTQKSGLENYRRGKTPLSREALIKQKTTIKSVNCEAVIKLLNIP